MERKEICMALIEKAVKARVCCFKGMLGREGKMKAPLCNSFVHGIRDASIATGIFTVEEAIRVENRADRKVMDADDISFDKSDMISLPTEDKISTCSYKCHLTHYLLVRLLSLLCGILVGFFFFSYFAK